MFIKEVKIRITLLVVPEICTTYIYNIKYFQIIKISLKYIHRDEQYLELVNVLV